MKEQKKRKKSSGSEQETKELKKQKKKDSKSSSNSDEDNKNESEDANDQETTKKKSNIENKERVEENVTSHIKIIKEVKTAFDKLIPKNQSGKFLMYEKNNNKDSQKSIQEIINNFTKADSVIKKYISEFKSDEKKKKFFKKQGFILT